MKNIEKTHQWATKVIISLALMFTMSCQQKSGNETRDYSDAKIAQQERNNLCEELETLYDISSPAKAKRVQKTFWGISFGENSDYVIYKKKKKGFNSSFARYKTSSPLTIVGDNPNCTQIILSNGCQFANHSFMSATLYFTPAPKERFFAIKFWYAEDSRQMFLDILKNYPLRKESSYSHIGDSPKDIILDTIYDYQGPRRVIKSIKKRFSTGHCSVKNYSYVNGGELWISSDCSELVYIDINILKEDVGKESDL